MTGSAVINSVILVQLDVIFIAQLHSAVHTRYRLYMVQYTRQRDRVGSAEFTTYLNVFGVTRGMTGGLFVDA